MAPAQKPQRKTRRSRKRARANSYEVSSDSDSDAGSSTPVKPSKTTAESAPASKMEVDGASSSSSDSSSSGSSDSSESDSDDSDSSSSSSSSSSSGGSTRAKGKGKAAAITRGPDEVRVRKRIPQIRENSPTPPPVSIPGFLSSVSEQGGDEGDRRSRFRKVYMEKLVEGFGSDLDKLRTSDPTMNPARLKRLIAGLQEAATLYETKTAAGKDGEVDEMSVVLGA